MSTGVIITLIICGTIIAIFLIALISQVIKAKTTLKNMAKFANRLDDIFKEEK